MKRFFVCLLSSVMLLSLLLPFALTIAAGAADADSADNASGIEGGNTVTNYAPNEKKTLEFSEELTALSYENVRITEGFIRDFTRLIVCEAIPADIRGVSRETGGLNNIKNAALKHRGESHGEFKGMFYVDENVHKTLEAMCYALSLDPMGDAQIIAAQKSIKDTLEEWIPYYMDAQEESGHFATYITLNGLVPFADKNLHELYGMGHFIEAAIAHYNYTEGEDTRLIDMAIKCADYIATRFGVEAGKLSQIPGHQEIEWALLRLAETVAKAGDGERAEKYIELSAFLLGTRGKGGMKYWQDHAPVEEQTEAVGHCVRAQYMYNAMAALAAIDDEYRAKYHNALESLWNDVTNTKQFVTGGVGLINEESFGASYELPNVAAYCETCAAIANMMWNRRMSTLYNGSRFSDQVETDLYNAILGCVALDGKSFFYTNYLSSLALRNEWYDTACCPPNLSRTLLSIGGYIYNVGERSLWVEQYISNDASTEIAGEAIDINMTSGFPSDGKVAISIGADEPTEFTLYLRVPYWSRGISLKLNGEALDAAADENGYIALSREWKSGDEIELEFGMEVIFEQTNEKVTANVGYVALRRGPLVYCAEYPDNTFIPSRAYIDMNSTPELVAIESLDNQSDPYGVRDMYAIRMGAFIQGFENDTPVEMTFIPFYARLNRGRYPMQVFVAKERLEDKPIQSYAIPSASFTFSTDSIYSMNDGDKRLKTRWTSYAGANLQRNPWVQYDFDSEVTLRGCKIWWYEDTGGVRLPKSFEIYYKNSETEDFVPVTHDGEYIAKDANGLVTYTFEEIKASAIRIVAKNSSHAVGIVEWELLGADFEYPARPSVKPPKPTDKPDIPETDEPTDVGTQTEKPAKSGCGSTLPTALIGVISALGCAIFFKKKD